MKKIFFSVIIVFCFLFIINIVLADLIPPECMGVVKNVPEYCKYGNYKGPLYLTYLFFNPSMALLFNFIINMSIIFLLSYFYLKFKKNKIIIILGVFATIIGAIIDSLSLFLSYKIHDIFYFKYSYTITELKNIFALSSFFISFLLLGIMYFLLIKRLFKIKSNKKIILSSIVLSILTNPVIWVLL